MPRLILLAVVAGLVTGCSSPQDAETPNKVLGTWRMVAARIDPDGRNEPAYGLRPSGLLVFTPDMRYIEVLTAGDQPRFASDARGEGTDAENRRAMASSIAHFGTYTVDAAGEFSGNTVEGSTFPNWVGDERTRDELTLTVANDRMFEQFRRPDGTRIAIEFERVR